MADNTQIKDEMVTVVVSRVIKAGQEKLYENWVKETRKEIEKFEGFRGTNLLRPKTQQSREYVVLFYFNDHKNLNAWMESEIREQMMKQVEPLTQGTANIQMGTGLEYWFVLPSKSVSLPPPRYKMVVMTWLAIVPLIFLIPPVIIGFLMDWPSFIQILPVAAIITLLMTYVVMPLMIRVFKFWLFPTY